MSMSESTKTMLQNHIDRMEVCLAEAKSNLADAEIIKLALKGTFKATSSMTIVFLSGQVAEITEEIEQLTNLLKEV